MSQYTDPDAIQSLNELNINYPETDYLNYMDMLDEAMLRLGKTKVDASMHPDYFDDTLRQLIDLVPLE